MSHRRTSLLLLPLLLAALYGCQDRELPTGPAPEGPAFATFPVGCDVGELIEAIAAANDETANPSGDVIELAAGCTYTLTQVHNNTHGPNGLPVITSEITINGNGARVEREAGAPAFRIFLIAAGATVNISELTIANGNSADNEGGGIFNVGTLTLTHSTISGNSATGGGATGGGGIFNVGRLTLTRSTISGNSATGGGADVGGGIYNDGTLTLTRSTVSGNSASVGGGIYSHTSSNFAISSTTILNSTISGNTSRFRGGGIENNTGLTRIVLSTITGNRAADGGGVWSFNDHHTRTDVKGSLIWGNTLLNGTDANDVAALRTDNRYHSLGYNLIGTAGANVDFNLEFNQAGDQTNVPAGNWLDALALNAPGSTETHALLEGSPAIDRGTCLDHEDQTVTTDQRGVSRPQGAACDIGAFEREQEAPSPADQIRALQEQVSSLELARGLETSLNAMLGEAIRALEAARPRPRTACNQLGAFISQVEAQAGKGIGEADAAALIEEALRIQGVIGC